jgi:hypothetical protein
MASNDDFCLITYLDAGVDAGRHSMCKKKHLSEFNFNHDMMTAILTHRSVKYNVQVLKSGDQAKINKLVIRYENGKSINTGDETDTDLGIKL